MARATKAMIERIYVEPSLVNRKVTLVSIGPIRRKPDDWFQRYTLGQESPRYPVPALRRCAWCNSDYNDVNRTCDFAGTGSWCPDGCEYSDDDWHAIQFHFG